MPWEFKAFWCIVNHQRNKIFKNVQNLTLNQVQINLSTNEHYGGLHTDAPDDTEMSCPLISPTGVVFARRYWYGIL